jgi:hypothetical protein
MITTILWPAIVSSFPPMPLREIIRKLLRIAASLAKSTATYQRQIDNYRHRYALDPPLCAA